MSKSIKSYDKQLKVQAIKQAKAVKQLKRNKRNLWS